MRRSMNLLPLLLLVAVVMMPALALAQEVIYVQQPTSWPTILLAIAVSAIPIVGAFLVPFVRRKFGEEAAVATEAALNLVQQRLQGSVGRAAGLAINELGTKAVTEVVRETDAAVTKGVDYLRETMGDTLKQLGLNTTAGEKKLRKMIVAQIGEKTASSLGATVAEPTVVIAERAERQDRT